MANRTRTNRNEFHLNDKEQYILDEKFKLSGMKSKSAFIRKLILYGYVYDVDYSFLREYNTELGRISSNLNQIAKRINSTNHVYQEDMDEVKELMKQVWQSQKSMLSQQPLIKEYTKERIKERIELKRERKAVIPKRDYADKRLIDTSDEKFQNSPGLQRWAAVENLKIAAQAYSEAGSIKELEQKIATTAATGKEAKQTVRKLENRIKDLAEIIKYAEQYKANKAYHTAYKKSKNPDAYFRKHESQIILYGGARRMLEQAGIPLKGLNIDKLKAEYQELTAQKKELTATYKNCEKELKSLNRKLKNLNQYLGRTEPPKSAQEQPDRELYTLRTMPTAAESHPFLPTLL